MRLRTRLILIIAVAALGPLSVLGIGATGVASRLLGDTISDRQGRTSDGLALYVDTWLSLQLRLITQQARTFRLGELDDPSLVGFLRLVYTQIPEANITSLVTRAGVDRVPRVPADPDEPLPEGRAPITRERFTRFRERLPAAIARATPGEISLGDPFRDPVSGVPALPVVLASPDGADLVLAVELSLQPIYEELRAQGGEARDVVLLDGRGGVIIDGQAGLVVPAVFQPFASGARAADIRYRTPEGEEVLASVSPVAGSGWMVVVAEPLALTTAAASAQIQARTAYVAAIAALLSLVLGATFARQVSEPVAALREAALAVAEGRFGRRVEGTADGELGELTRAFNFMSKRLERNRAEIESKNAEIEAFNVELQSRVDARTRELQEAQERLIQSARLAAAGEMGAGLAHELNNPLAGILGLTQVLLHKAEAAQRGTLKLIEEQTLRCKEIVTHLLRFTANTTPSGPVDRNTKDVVDLDEVLVDVLALVRSPFRQRGVTLEHHRDGALPVRGDRAQLATALTQLLASLRAAAGAGGALNLRGARIPGAVELRFELATRDTGVGRDDWMASGLGLWAAQQTFVGHGGQLLSPPKDGPPKDALVWRVILPEA